MSSYKEERRLDWIICGTLIIVSILVLNFFVLSTRPYRT